MKTQMRVTKAIGEFNKNNGSGPGHSCRIADIIPVGSIVEATQETVGGYATTKVKWLPPGGDSYGNTEIFADLYLVGSEYLEEI